MDIDAVLETRIAGFVFSILMSTGALGGTVLSMWVAPLSDSAQVVALERASVSAAALS